MVELYHKAQVITRRKRHCVEVNMYHYQAQNSTGTGCPVQFNCSVNGTQSLLVSFDIGTGPTYASIVSSSLSCIGSLLILLAFWVLKEMRTVAQKIITLLALVDFITAIGYLIAAWNFLTHFNVNSYEECVTFRTVCKAQSFITTWSTLCSFGWTVALALHFYLIVRYCKQQLLSKILLVENILVWLLPALIVIPLLATNNLGYTRYATSNWCYIRDTDYPSSHLRDSGTTIVLMLIAGSLWELLSYIAVIVLYSLTRKEYGNKVRVRSDSGNQAGVEKRLLLIPLVFILLRMWGTIQFLFSLSTSDLNQQGCIPQWVQTVYLVLGILQAIGDGGQGWGNALLYIFLSSTIRQELFLAPCSRIGCIMKEETSITHHRHSTSAVNIVSKDHERNPLLKRNVNYSSVYSGSAVPLLSSGRLVPKPQSESRA